MATRGVVYVHSTPLAVCPHVEWAISRVLATPVSLRWTVQPIDPAARRAECGWTGPPGTGAELAAALRQWPMIRFEITEEPTTSSEGTLFSCTPDLGIFHAMTGPHGDILIPEDRLKAAVVKAALGDTTLLLEIGGHVGYAVRPAFRGRGYATAMLRQSVHRLAVLGVTEVLVTCDDDNIASVRVIERCGGVLQDIRRLADEAPPIRRYWIQHR